MIESLSKALVENELDPDAFAPVKDAIYRALVPVEGITKRWQSLLKVSPQTRYWPILCDDSLDLSAAMNADVNAIVSRAPQGTIRELLQPIFEERREQLGEIASELA